tara:strand:- start:29 stop:406 length:378 start_codon:yes stop_codon:yes gene_type:complete
MCDFGYIDHILTGLKVIGMIKEGQKVSVRNGLLNIDDRRRGALTGLIRWINNDNRHNTLSYIRNVVNNAISIASKTPEHRGVIEDGLSGAITGLSSLSVTYSDDAAISASIDVMKERIVNYKKNL